MSFTQPLISVIVPIYNVESYLDRCVSSILKQSYTKLEIILVDDGSKDSCPQLCDKYVGIDPRIKVIHKPNGGLSDARNSGLDIAKGELISFIDADDYISPDFFKIMYEQLEKTKSDVSVCDYLMTKKNEFLEDNVRHKRKICNGRKEIMDSFFKRHSGKTIIVCNKLYKKDLFEGIRFPKGQIHEDEATTYKIFYKCNRVIYISDKLYYYYQRDGSITGHKINKKSLDIFPILEQVVRFYQDNGEKCFERKAKMRYFKIIKIYQCGIHSQYLKSNKEYGILQKKLEKIYKDRLKEYDMYWVKTIFDLYGYLRIFYFKFIKNRKSKNYKNYDLWI